MVINTSQAGLVLKTVTAQPQYDMFFETFRLAAGLWVILGGWDVIHQETPVHSNDKVYSNLRVAFGQQTGRNTDNHHSAFEKKTEDCDAAFGQWYYFISLI